ncbi:MAG: hypothetical protein ACFFB3_11205 [Candidatus Hodarchaeota archaeon]
MERQWFSCHWGLRLRSYRRRPGYDIGSRSDIWVGAEVRVIFRKDKEIFGKSDLITNTGFVRPIDREMISLMKRTAVIPLIWKTRELREADLDLQACWD